VRTLLLTLGLVFYPLVVHGLVILQVPHVAVFGLVAASLAYLLVLGFKGGQGVAPVWLWMYGLLALIGLLSLYARSVHVLFLPPVLINLGLLAVFSASLRSGTVPLVERLMRIAYAGELPPGLPALARRLTWLWVVFFAGMVLLSVALAHWATLAVWSLFVNVLYYFFVAAMLILQHVYRHFRFRQYGTVSLWQLGRKLTRISPRDPNHPFFGRGRS
jgi:uncharacterized membrane protein